MKYTKLFYGNQYVTKFRCDGKRMNQLQRFMYHFKRKMLFIAKMCVIAWMIVGGAKMIEYKTPVNTVYADKEVIKIEKMRFEDFPLLQRICKAESGNRQFNSKGDILRGYVEPSDVGYCQINEAINNDLARRLGYDIYTEKGNKAFAVYLFTTRGYAPWMASHKSNMPNGGWSIE